MFEKFFNLIYPNVCGFCNKLNEESLCKKCEIELKKYEIAKIQDFSKNKSKYFDYLINMLKYENYIRERIISYKFGEQAYLYKTFSKIILNNQNICNVLHFYDIIIPVPMYKSKKNERGYNQTELIAKKLAKELNIQYENKYLIKNKNTKVQSTLTKIQREQNVKGAFTVTVKEKIQERSIILLDDIYTTGSTVNECAKALKNAGASRILVLTIAKD